MDKLKVARSFSRSASTYDSVAYFQREVGEKLLQQLLNDCPFDRPGICMDLGCGPGSFYHKLKNTFKYMNYIGVDIAEGMLQFFKKNHPVSEKISPLLLCADAEQLPFAEQSIDLIYSNMALQWCEQLPILFDQLYQTLKPGGYAGLTSLGTQTLYELKQAWHAVDELVHVNQFATSAEWNNYIQLSGFEVVEFQTQNFVLEYSSVMDLLKELKLLGAHNVNDGQRQSLTAPKRLQELFKAYESFVYDGSYPATYEVHFWVLRKK
jgi:malonyl-CoA O-methyltransferase